MKKRKRRSRRRKRRKRKERQQKGRRQMGRRGKDTGEGGGGARADHLSRDPFPLQQWVGTTVHAAQRPLEAITVIAHMCTISRLLHWSPLSRCCCSHRIDGGTEHRVQRICQGQRARKWSHGNPGMHYTLLSVVSQPTWASVIQLPVSPSRQVSILASESCSPKAEH